MVIRGGFEMRKTGALAMRNGGGFGANNQSSVCTRLKMGELETVSIPIRLRCLHQRTRHPGQGDRSRLAHLLLLERWLQNFHHRKC